MKKGIIPSELFGDLPVMKFCFHVDFGETQLPTQFLGSAWRGLIGWEMQRLICPFDRRPPCKKCSIREQCPYFKLFEEQSSISGLIEAPRGYVFYPPISGQVGAARLYVTLFGDCVKLLPVVVKSIFKGCASGLGRERVPYRVSAWKQILPGGHTLDLPLNSDGYLAAKDVTALRTWLSGISKHETRDDVLIFHILTPLRLRKKGSYMGNLEGAFLLSTIARRLEALCSGYNNGQSLGKERWEALKLQFSTIGDISGKLKWEDYARYSNRQKTKVPMGGIVGKAITHNPPVWFLEWLQAANLVHAGKGAAMGLGRIEI